mmetsp:Transcript_20335/g.41468  ORF Transcript_20335/g.41468 Transcript_20335/m.41468 type:complete len:512 (-) Transcript_20335:1886-3421(-)
MLTNQQGTSATQVVPAIYYMCIPPNDAMGSTLKNTKCVGSNGEGGRRASVPPSYLSRIVKASTTTGSSAAAPRTLSPSSSSMMLSASAVGGPSDGPLPDGTNSGSFAPLLGLGTSPEAAAPATKSRQISLGSSTSSSPSVSLSSSATNLRADSSSTKRKRRPQKPKSAYTYFFHDQCRQLVRDGHYDAYRYCDSATSTADSSRSHEQASPSSSKRRKANSGSPIPPLGDMGKIIAQRWRELDVGSRARYEEMADRDSERYRDEIESYYRSVSVLSDGGGFDDVRACLVAGRAGASGGGPARPAIRHSSSGAGEDGTAGKSICSSMSTRTVSPPITGSFDRIDTSAICGSRQLSQPPARGGRKSFLQAQLAQKRSELLSDMTTLNEVTTSRIAAGRPAFKQDAAVMQRVYNLSNGPAGGSIFGGIAGAGTRFAAPRLTSAASTSSTASSRSFGLLGSSSTGAGPSPSPGAGIGTGIGTGNGTSIMSSSSLPPSLPQAVCRETGELSPQYEKR